MSSKGKFYGGTLIMFTKEKCAYLVQCYGIGDVSYKYAIALFHQNFLIFIS